MIVGVVDRGDDGIGASVGGCRGTSVVRDGGGETSRRCRGRDRPCGSVISLAQAGKRNGGGSFGHSEGIRGRALIVGIVDRRDDGVGAGIGGGRGASVVGDSGRQTGRSGGGGDGTGRAIVGLTQVAESDGGGGFGHGEGVGGGLGGDGVGGGGKAVRVVGVVGVGGAGTGIEIQLQIILVGLGNNIGDCAFPKLVVVGVGVPGEGIRRPAHARGSAVEKPAAGLVDESAGIKSVGVVELFHAGKDGQGVRECRIGGGAHSGSKERFGVVWAVPGEGQRQGAWIGGGQKFCQIKPSARLAVTVQAWNHIDCIGACYSCHPLSDAISWEFGREQSDRSGDEGGGKGSSAT